SQWAPPSDGGVCRYSGIYSLADGWESPNPGAPNYQCDPNPEGSFNSGQLYTLDYCAWGWWCDLSHVPPAQPPNYFVFGTQTFNGGQHQPFINYLADVTLFFNDNEPPTVDNASSFPSGASGSNGWISQDTTFTGHAHDPGVGVLDLSLSSDNGSTLQNASAPAPANG